MDKKKWKRKNGKEKMEKRKWKRKEGKGKTSCKIYIFIFLETFTF